MRTTRPTKAATAGLLALILAGCEHEPAAPSGHAVALSEIPATLPETQPSVWLEQHWTFPVPAQGDPPAHWTALEQRLDPEACGTCHPAQLEDWADSWHALGMGPGLMGQLVDWDGSNDRTVAQCQTCHAPLTEQHVNLYDEVAEVYLPNPAVDHEMREEGLTCAGCHVRGHTRYGPAKEGRPADETGRALATGPHDGFVPKDEFQSAEFCSRCHDFRSNQLALEGKLVQETGPEWARTPYAADGVTCQSCHMPEGRHLWKGVHDPEMVASAVDVTGGLEQSGSYFSPVRASLTLENVGAGHRLPTYTTPEIQLILVQVDASGTELSSTRRQATIGRRLTPNLSKERFDTRLLPGEALTLPYAARRHADASVLVARVEVWPDEAYRRFYEIKLRRPENHEKGEALLREAMANSIQSRFVLWEDSWAL